MEVSVLQEAIESKIFIIREQKVMIDRDLAILYGVSTKRLNEQVKRNIQRFPKDFMFTLSLHEKNELVAICDRFITLKHSTVFPYAFTEQGVAMLSSVLNSERAILVNIQIIRTFTKLRQILYTHKDLQQKIDELIHAHGGKLKEHDQQIQAIFDVINQLVAPPEDSKKKYGFLVDK